MEAVERVKRRSSRRRAPFRVARAADHGKAGGKFRVQTIAQNVRGSSVVEIRVEEAERTAQ